ncbi:hypothetical protein Mnod_7683 (plasmid) [Methylobacterium nodulans ORS 2060]|uniref:Uncharacterized protein n=2 Tax=Methylobacterium nodulans TaxID=114616 RepID=B8IXY7_METNO|nr:hypothetical protein Mnod_7683 [Methylobacterium nodulans ORS 2060]
MAADPDAQAKLADVDRQIAAVMAEREAEIRRIADLSSLSREWAEANRCLDVFDEALIILCRSRLALKSLLVAS